MKTNKLLIALALTASLGVTAAYAMDRGEQCEGKQIQRLSKQLSLTDVQQQKIQTLIEQHKSSFSEHNHESMTKDRETMKKNFIALLEAPQFDEKKALSHLQQRADDRVQRKLAKLSLQHAIYQQLSSEQREDYLKMMAKRHHRMGGENKHNGHGH